MVAPVALRIPERVAVRANMLLPGLYAWTLTVATPAFRLGAPLGARIAAWVAVSALLAGGTLAPSLPRLGRALGIVTFVGSSLAVWVLLGPSVGVQRVEPVVSGLGGLGWLLFALGCGSVRSLGRVPEDDPRVLRGPTLAGRSRLPRGAMAVLTLAILAALVPMSLAWIPRRPAQALLAQSVALLAAVALVSVGALVATERGRSSPSSALPARMRLAASPLALLGCLLLVGTVWVLLR